MIVLGIETSCDETAASIVVDGREILSSIISSQVDVHHVYGGVVPELASRKHIECIVPVVEEAVQSAGIHPGQIDALAVTQGPGLIGSLLVGFSFAKSYALSLNIPWVGVNHLMGHINSVFLESNNPDFPFVALLVSGGHTSIYYVTSYTEAELMGQTRDDAAGEAFDKVSKMLGLGYPGGKVISTFSKKGRSDAIDFPRTYLDKTGFDFSFSGIKSSVNRYIQTYAGTGENHIADIAASFQEAVVEVLSNKIIHASVTKKCAELSIVGGVAANDRLREKVKVDASKMGKKVYIPSIGLCGDNAAMIASCGYHYIKQGNISKFDEDVYSRVR